MRVATLEWFSPREFVMSYGNPDRLLAEILPEPQPRNKLGHTPLQDFEHACSYSGLTVERAGAAGFAWAKFMFVAGWLAKLDGNGAPD